MRLLSSTIALAAFVFSSPVLAARPVTDCPGRDAPFSIDSPLVDLFLSPAARAIVNREMGGALDKAVDRYNQFAGSLERNVLTSARRLETLAAAHPDKALPDMPSLDGRTRPLSKLAPPPEPS